MYNVFTCPYFTLLLNAYHLFTLLFCLWCTIFWFTQTTSIYLFALSDETGSRDRLRDQNGLESVSRPFWDQNVTLPRVTRLVSRPFLRPKWSRFRSRDQYRHQNVTQYTISLYIIHLRTFRFTECDILVSIPVSRPESRPFWSQKWSPDQSRHSR